MFHTEYGGGVNRMTQGEVVVAVGSVCSPEEDRGGGK